MIYMIDMIYTIDVIDMIDIINMIDVIDIILKIFCNQRRIYFTLPDHQKMRKNSKSACYFPDPLNIMKMFFSINSHLL